MTVSLINEFLRRAYARLQSKCGKLTVVMGNEAGDMDSIVGSIYLAMLLDKNPRFGFENVIPVLNFPRKELPLRNDVYQLFKEMGVESSHLLFVQSGNDCKDMNGFVDLKELMPYVVLYDHNKLLDAQNFLESNIVGIVDHHFDEQKYVATTDKLRRLRVVGSACTLVCELYKEAEERIVFPSLLAAPIVLDTVNFDPAQKKVTPEDITAFEWLQILAQDNHENLNPGTLFAKLSNWKQEIFGLSVEQNLIRDYKQFQFIRSNVPDGLRVGISSIPCSYEEFVEAYNVGIIFSDCDTFYTERKLDALVIAFAGKAGGVHSRQVAFFADVANMPLFVAYAAEKPSGISFTQLIRKEGESDMIFIAYSLSDSSVSRKRLVPSLQAYLENGKASSL